jgi:4'-phosphopantetheinyl transferase
MSVSPSQHSAAPASTNDAAARDRAPEARVYWTVAYGLDQSAIQRLTGELSDEEARRARAFHFDRDRATYIAAHAMLRRVLRETPGGEEPDFVRSPLGRPELAPPRDGGPAPYFNLTHTRGFAACAILYGAPIGVDAEDIRRPIDIAEMAARWFVPPERRLLEKLCEARRPEMFFRIWTLKEAIVKATGHGLRIEPQRFAVDPDHSLASIPKDLGIPTRWRLAELAPLPHIRLALAAPGQGRLEPSLARIKLR